jgi:hypothetical protein
MSMYQGPAELHQNEQRVYYGEAHLQADSDRTAWLGHLVLDQDEPVELTESDTWGLRLLDGVTYSVAVTSVKVENGDVLVMFSGVGTPPSALS